MLLATREAKIRSKSINRTYTSLLKLEIKSINIKNSISHLSKPDVIELFLLFFYFIFWTYIEWKMYTAFNIGVWDLGVNFSLAYKYPIPNFFQNPSETRKLAYLMFVPIAHFWPNPFSLIIAENVLIAISGLYLYKLAKKFGMNHYLSVLLCGTYLFNYAFFGVNFDPIHYQALFPIFFVIGYYFRHVNQEGLGAFFIFLSALASSLSAITVLFYIVFIGMPTFKLLERRIKLVLFLKENVLLVFVFIIITAIITTSMFFFGTNGYLSGGHFVGQTANFSISTFFSKLFLFNFRLKLIYLGIVLGPYIYYVTRSKISILLLPFLFLIFVTSFTPYYLLRYTYTYDLSVPLFLTIINQSGNINFTNVSAKGESLRKKLRRFFSNKHTNIFLAFVSIVVLLDMVILPFAPLNSYSGNNFENSFWDYKLSSKMTMSQNDIYVHQMLDYIPMNASVLGESNMPQLSNRNLWYSPFTYSGDPTMKYIIVDPYSLSPNPFINIANDFNNLTNNYKYGVIAELNGSILVEQGFLPSNVMFVPLKEIFNASAFQVSSNSELTLKTATFLAPGSYSIVLSLLSQSILTQNITNMFIKQANPLQNNINLTISKENFSISDSGVMVSLNFTTKSYLYGVTFVIGTKINRSTELKNLIVLEVRPPKVL